MILRLQERVSVIRKNSNGPRGRESQCSTGPGIGTRLYHSENALLIWARPTGIIYDVYSVRQYYKTARRRRENF